MGRKIREIIEIWREFTEKNSSIKLNPDYSKVERLAQGVLENEKNHGLKFCPCRLRTGEANEDLKLVCPCNFFIQKTWIEAGECWCGLFFKNNF